MVLGENFSFCVGLKKNTTTHTQALALCQELFRALYMHVFIHGYLHKIRESGPREGSLFAFHASIKHLLCAGDSSYHVHFPRAWCGPCLPQTPPGLLKSKVRSLSGSASPSQHGSPHLPVLALPPRASALISCKWWAWLSGKAGSSLTCVFFGILPLQATGSSSN